MSDINNSNLNINRLKFGTAGIRAEMKRGAGFLNAVTIEKIAAGTADFLFSLKHTDVSDISDKNSVKKTDILEKNENLIKTNTSADFDKNKISVVICYDSRKNSRLFARICARVFASRGILAYLPNRCAPTPYLSFAVRSLGAAAGIMITASHNTKEYNGYKLYGADGCQLTDAAAEQVSDFISRKNQKHAQNQAQTSKEYKNGKDRENKNDLKSFSHYAQNGDIKAFDLSLQYLSAVTAQTGVNLNSVKESGLKIVYTPLCGVGGAWAKKLFKNNPNFFTVPEEFKPDSEFTSCPVPNPEKKEAYAAAIKYAQKINADLILANDPDADRLGVMVKSSDGFRLLSGNETGVLLLNYLLEENKLSEKINTESVNKGGNNSGGFTQKPLAVRSIVSTPMADSLIFAFGGEIETVPTGFKYIGEKITALEQKGEANRFLLGFEESHGFLSGAYARDKDGILAAALITSYAAKLKNNSQTLLNALETLYKQYGYYKHKTLSYKLDSGKISGIMAKLRGGEDITGLKIDKIKDYLTDNGQYNPDMLGLSVKYGTIIIRPSGTEPLIKVYLTAQHDSPQKSDELIAAYEKICNNYFS